MTNKRCLTKEHGLLFKSLIDDAIQKGYSAKTKPTLQQIVSKQFADMGISRQSFVALLRIFEDDFKIQIDYNPATVAKTITPLEPASHEANQNTLRATEEIRQLRTENRKLRKMLIDTEDLRTFAFALSAAPVFPPDWLIKPNRDSTNQKLELIFFTSDYQYGEVIDSRNIGNINEYNPEIFVTRFKKMVQKFCTLPLRNYKPEKIGRIFYLRGGDSISGALHLDLMRTDAKSPIRSIVEVTQHEIWAIRQIELAYPGVEIVVISIPGNHDRTTEKPVSKGYKDYSYEFFASVMLERHFALSGSKIKFYSPDSGDALFNFAGLNCLLVHGDRIGTRGGKGFVGPVATISRGIQLLRLQYAKMGQPIDMVFMGHWHTVYWLPFGLVNGSLAGPSEYSLITLRTEPMPACQLLITGHPEHGIISVDPIYVAEDETKTIQAPTPAIG